MKLNSHLLNLLKKLFPDFNQETLQIIFESGRQQILKGGEYLFHQGDVKQNMYIVLKGRLRAFEEKNGRTKVLGDIGTGESVGEMAFFSDEARMASVRAIRESLVLEFSPANYMDFVTSDADTAASLFKLIVKRLRRNTFEVNKSAAPKNIAIVKLNSSEDFEELRESIKVHFRESENPVQFIDEKSSFQSNSQHVFETLEEWDGINVLFCDDSNIEWANQCVIYSDLVIVACSFDADPKVRDIEKQLDLYSQDILHKKVYLLLIHDSVAPMPQQTKQWFEERSVDLHIHLRRKNPKDYNRFCRIISHKATGLVLGGGGAKGFAHIGVVKALVETGIEIDILGGTSAGALYGIGMAYADFDMKMIYELNAEGIKRKLTSGDLNLPLISLMTGRKFKKYLKEIFQDTGLEDIWINTFCISTNISKAVMHVHKKGPIWKQILASMAIPGVFPPVIINKNLHVDGGVMDNLPIEPIYHYAVDRIFAVSLSSFHFKEIELEEIPSSWTILKDKFIGKRKYSLPGIASLITNSMVINSYQKQEATKNKVSHYLELDLKGVKMLDDKNWEEIIQKGYDQTKTYLKDNGLNNQLG